MLGTLALLCIWTAYLVSSGPVGIRLCHVLCDRDCSCSAPSYDSKQMTCEFLSNSTKPSKLNGMNCTSGSCRAVHTRRGAVICVKQHNNLVREKNTAVKSRKNVDKKTSQRFEIPPNSLNRIVISLKKMGVDVGSLCNVLFELGNYKVLYITWLRVNHCALEIQLEISSRHKYVKIRAYDCKRTFVEKREYVVIKDKTFFNLHWENEMVMLSVCHFNKSSPRFILENFRNRHGITDLDLRADGNKVIVEVV